MRAALSILFLCLYCGVLTAQLHEDSIATIEPKHSEAVAKKLAAEGKIQELLTGLTNPHLDVQGYTVAALSKTSDKSVIPVLLDYLDSIKESVDGSEEATTSTFLKKQTLDAIRANSNIPILQINVSDERQIEKVIRDVAAAMQLPELRIRPILPPKFLQEEKAQAPAAAKAADTARPPAPTK